MSNVKVKTKISEAQFFLNKSFSNVYTLLSMSFLEVKLQTKSMCLAGRCVNLIQLHRPMLIHIWNSISK